MSVTAQEPQPELERPPDYGDYRPPRTTAEGGATMLLSGVFLAGAIVVLGLAVYTKLADVRTKFLEQGAEPVGNSPAEMAVFVKEEMVRWQEVIRSANVTLSN